jgi:hypothetical protein
LLAIMDEEGPVRVLRAGGVPRLGELRLHNGTVYRWNRPVYDVANGRPHLRVENRVLPSGPTVIDLLADAAFYFGLIRQLSEEERPVWSQLPFAAAEETFHARRAEPRTDSNRGPARHAPALLDSPADQHPGTHLAGRLTTTVRPVPPRLRRSSPRERHEIRTGDLPISPAGASD